MTKLLPVGSRSLLFGVHLFWFHPLMVAYAWWRLYGFPKDLRLWLSFALHDLGYWGRRDMDGPDGERHVELGADLMGTLFGEDWRQFTLLHSRFYAQRLGLPPSRLCMADKYSFVLEHRAFYLWRARLSGEIHEYLSHRQSGKYAAMGRADYLNGPHTDLKGWHQELREHLRGYVLLHAHLATPEPRG